MGSDVTQLRRPWARRVGWGVAWLVLVAASMTGIDWLSEYHRPVDPIFDDSVSDRVDALGDPLPRGAIARLGSGR